MSWFAIGHEPSSLQLLEGHPDCPSLALRFYNTPVHDVSDEYAPDALDAGMLGTIWTRVRYAAAGEKHEHEGIYLDAGQAWVMRDPETWEDLDILLVDEHETGLACLELPVG